MTFRFLDREPHRKVFLVDPKEIVDHATAQALAAIIGPENALDLTEEQVLAICGGSIEYENFEVIQDALAQLANDSTSINIPK